MSNLEMLIGSEFSHNGETPEDGFYLKCPFCKKSYKLKGDINQLFEHPHTDFGECDECLTEFSDVIFAVKNSSVVYVVIKRKLYTIDQKLLEIDPEYHDLLISLIAEKTGEDHIDLDVFKNIIL